MHGLCLLRGGGLRRVHDVDGRLLLLDECPNRLVDRLRRPRILQRHRTLGVGDLDDVAPGRVREGLLKTGGVAKGG